ncbi:MAG: DsrE family protein [Pirellulales bacterium]
MRGISWIAAGLALLAAGEAVDDRATLHYPLIAQYGGVARVPDAAEPPRQKAKIIFDITADSQPGEPNKGLESVARYLNLHADAGWQASDARLALVLHGAATKAALADTAYATHTGEASNPSGKLIHELKARGVDVFVCGQSLARNQFAVDEVADEVTVAVSAMTVNANKQQDGYSYLSIH